MSAALSAALLVCGRCADVEDARTLLDMLGLLDADGLTMPDPGVLEVRNIRDIVGTNMPTSTRRF